MSTPTVYEMLQNEIRTLPEALAEEVFDFVMFTKARRVEEEFLWKRVKESRTYRAQHPEDVATVTPRNGIRLRLTWTTIPRLWLPRNYRLVWLILEDEQVIDLLYVGPKLPDLYERLGLGRE